MTLKEAMKLDSDGLNKLYDQLNNNIQSKKELGAYVEQLKGEEIKKIKNAVPIAIKDIINVKNRDMSCCSKILQGYVSPYNATVIDKMEEAGLVAYGRANMDEFAMGSETTTGCYGATKNPIDPTKTAGGSSGGSACAVASGQAIAALGTDTGGSIRQPASYCGVVGMKPTYGRVSRYGIASYSSSLDQCGPITQNVEDSAILYDIISGYDKKDSTSADIKYEKIAPQLDKNQKFTIAVIDNYINDASDQVQKAFKDTIALLEQAGHKIVHKNLMDTKKHISTYYIVATAEASANLSRYDGIRYGSRVSAQNLQQTYEDTKTQGFGKEVQKRIMLGSFVLSSGYYDAYYIKAQKVRHLIKDDFEKVFEDADVILCPVAPTTAPKLGGFKKALDMYLSDMYTISVNLSGLPAISLPVANDEDGMPIGLQLISKAYDEKTMFNMAYSLETIVNYQRRDI